MIHIPGQPGCLIYAADLAQSLVKMPTLDIQGVVHATGTGDCTWYELTSSIVSVMGQQTSIYLITTAEADRRAARPSYSVLANGMLKQSGITIPHWKNSPVQFVKIAAVYAAT